MQRRKKPSSRARQFPGREGPVQLLRCALKAEYYTYSRVNYDDQPQRPRSLPLHTHCSCSRRVLPSGGLRLSSFIGRRWLRRARFPGRSWAGQSCAACAGGTLEVPQRRRPCGLRFHGGKGPDRRRTGARATTNRSPATGLWHLPLTAPLDVSRGESLAAPRARRRTREILQSTADTIGTKGLLPPAPRRAVLPAPPCTTPGLQDKHDRSRYRTRHSS
jgi:hypothetical protein